jgi:DeoR/GlpR family transcriptional regulator of sugar metabolism
MTVLIEPELIPAERQRLLLACIERDGRVSSVQAASQFGVSEDTIRRDLRDLAEAGLIERVHGGALRKLRQSHAFVARLTQNENEKQRLAAHARTLLRLGMTALLDQSTTNLVLARELSPELDLTIVTPSPDIAVAALDRGLSDVILIGGRVDPRSRGVGGAAALQQIAQLRPDICFLGACAIDAEAGVTANDDVDAALKRAMVEVSACVVVLAAAEKLDTRAPFAVVSFAGVDRLVTEADLSEAQRRRYGDAGVELHLV